MKILVLSQNWFPENGVPQRRWQWLVSQLTDRGHEVGVIAPPPQSHTKNTYKDWLRQLLAVTQGKIEAGQSGESIWRCMYFPAGKSLTSRVLNQASVALGQLIRAIVGRQSVRNFSPDLIIGTVPALPTAFVTYLTSRALGCQYWIDLRDAWPDLLSYSSHWNTAVGTRSLRERILRLGPAQFLISLTNRMLIFVLENSSTIIVTSEFLKQSLEKKLNSKNPQRKVQIEVVRNVFPREFSSEDLTDSDFGRRNSKQQIRILYAGTIGRAQDLMNVFRAAEIVKTSGIDIQLKFVGTGPGLERLQEAFNASSITAEFYPKKDAAELLEFYQWADTALVHLASWEPLKRAVPSKTYELMEIGLHITGVVSGETSELIRYLNAGSVVPPSNPDALAELWIELALAPDNFETKGAAREWVVNERTLRTPKVLSRLLDAEQL